MKFLKDKPLKEKLSFVGLVLLSAIVLYGLISGYLAKQGMKTHYCYTIAVTDGKEYFPRRGVCVIYKYKVDGKNLIGTELIGNRNIKINGGYYPMKVYTKDTDYEDVYFNLPIKDTTNFCLHMEGKCCN